MNFNIKKFNMETIVERCQIDSHKSPMIVLIGKKDTGKSFLVKDILANTQACFPIGTVISGTEVANPFFQDIVPSKLIHDKYKPEIVMNSIKRQLAVKQTREHEKRSRGGNSNLDPRAFLILDDCLYDASWIREESTRYVFMNGRHIDMVTLITMQYPLGITPNLRTNIDFVFILRENGIGNRKRIYENFAGMFPTFEMFCQFMDQCTENYECLVINNSAQSNKLSEQVFWYKADMHNDFKLGSKEFWELSKDMNSDDEDEKYDPNNTKKRGQGQKINVKKTKW